MSSTEAIVLIVLQGDKCIYEEAGFYDIWTVAKNGKTMISVRHVVTDKYIFEDLPIKVMSTKAPYVTIRAEETS